MILHRVMLALLAIVTSAHSSVIAETFTVPLTPAVSMGTHGDYLSASFDFGTSFSRIDSVTLEFVMPAGYEGTAVTTRNSTYTRYLSTLIHDATSLIDDLSFDPFQSLSNLSFHVTAGVPNELQYDRFIVFPGGDPADHMWPEFLFGGSGRVEFIDIHSSSFHPLPSGTTVSFSTSWLIPPEIVSAQLKIVGTAVPEPATWQLMAVILAPALACRKSMSRIAKKMPV